MKKIKLILADDHKIVSVGLASLLSDENMVILGIVVNGVELIEMLKTIKPDVILLDLNMPEMDGHQALSIIKNEYPEIKVIILSMNYYEYTVAEVIINGASAFLKKETDIDEIVKVIREVHSKGFYFNDEISKNIFEQLKQNKKLYYLIGDAKFSQRELEVLREICKDLTPHEISENLDMKIPTFRFHKKQLMEKTKSNSVISLVKYAIKNRIVKERE